jgi:hypothetical protein
MEKVEVIARFTEQGTINPLRLVQNGNKIPITSFGRSWQDEKGYHILVMLSSETVKELLFEPSTMKWYIKNLRGPHRL